MGKNKLRLNVCAYFVDEAGDATLFDRRGRTLVGSEGCSRFFAVGMARINEPERLRQELEILRADILTDKYFKGIPSLNNSGKRTAQMFHAKDDIPEVRREVFRILDGHAIKFKALFRDKKALLQDVSSTNRVVPEYRYKPNSLYDEMVESLFMGQLHRHHQYRVCFARRGKSDRTEALLTAIRNAQTSYLRRLEIDPKTAPPFEVTSANSRSCPELQAVDYLLWAVQRLFERGESRFSDYIWKHVSMVVDCDAKFFDRDARITYGKNKPLKPEMLRGR